LGEGCQKAVAKHLPKVTNSLLSPCNWSAWIQSLHLLIFCKNCFWFCGFLNCFPPLV